MENSLQVTPQLSICIPTLNRANVLQRVLTTLAEAVRDLPVEVCVSDNASSDETPQVIAHMSGRFPQFRCVRLQERVVYASNVLSSVSLSSACYVWVLADYALVSPSVLRKILLNVGSCSVDAVILNIARRIGDYEDRHIGSALEAFRRYGWHTTLLGSSVVRRDAYLKYEERYAGSDFIQVLACFLPLADLQTSARIEWLGEDAWVADPAKKISWGSNVLAIWMQRWRDVCLSMSPAYPLSVCKEVIQAHHRGSGVFSLSALCLFRSVGGCTLKELWALRSCWADTGWRYVVRTVLAALIPQRIASWVWMMLRMLSKGILKRHSRNSQTGM